jgi:hypothetical protein
VPRLFGRLWRSGGRRAELAEAGSPEREPTAQAAEPHTGREELGRRLEQARQRLRQTIPPPEDPNEP